MKQIQGNTGAKPWDQWRLGGWGAFLFLLGIFLFSHPGRIDSLDAQVRFEVSRNMVNLVGPAIRDYYILSTPLPKNPTTGKTYSFYTAPASLVPIPLMVVARAFVGNNVATDHFSFCIVSAFAGACIGPLLLAFFRRLGVDFKQALGWMLVFGLTTLWWPGSETAFDQCQHGVALLGMIMTAYDVVKRGSWGAAFAAGLLGGLLVNYRIPFVALLPAIPVYWFLEAKRAPTEGNWKSRVFAQTCLFGVGIAICFAGYAYYNWVRYGSVNMPHFDNGGAQMLANPITGFLTLSISPGKGVLWFSPPLVLAIIGFKQFFKAERGLAGLIFAITVLHFGEMSCLSFASGDECWGPRYMMAIMPLWALAFPYIAVKVAKSVFAYTVIGLGLIIQLMAVSVDNSRFFSYRRLPPNFFLDGWAYFKYSQLLARPAELLENIQTRNKVRPHVTSTPDGDITYMPFGPAQHMTVSKTGQRIITFTDPRVFQEDYKVFYAPRPWWGWINEIPTEKRPVPPGAFFGLCLVSTVLGAGLLWGAVGRKQ